MKGLGVDQMVNKNYWLKMILYNTVKLLQHLEQVWSESAPSLDSTL